MICGAMPVRLLQLEEFSAFEAAAFEFVDGLNVLIGANGTGKTHVLKVIYTILQSVGRLNLHEKLARVFLPENDEIGRLVRRRPGINTGTVSLYGRGPGKISFSVHTKGILTGPKIHAWSERAPAVFLPSREILAMYEGFISAYQKRELSFDETYYDACVALNASPVRGARKAAAEHILLVELRKALGGHVELSGDRFYVRFKGDRAPMEAHLVAEGLRKIASLERLLINGSLTENGYLFWDEPEANLNPRLIVIVADVLRRLAMAGIQIFVTTHDFLLARRLSVSTELPDSPRTRFFSLHRPSAGAPVRVDRADTLAGLPANPIEEEFAKHYDFEMKLSLAQEAR